ncbi:uncharacterized protein SPSK_02798 [Sporothrix schenckii 1099-18]|uniref:Uncharacterized protein n=1 Tax=Sporothrix schenckii 1099-18 TaxID=1397361 RepID=A0A0F2M9A6_SPOSC|nr:uncharacterized protein SPSK_02798 [Sporothrix schenckii 1099-18]KJR86288.1 hypothetical protein SPSK_02798 [Sporothrix schenckii 1099-18]
MVLVVSSLTVVAVSGLGAPVGGAAVSAAVSAGSTVTGIPVVTSVVALGEGALVGIGSLAGGSSSGIALATLAGPVGAAVVGYAALGSGTVVASWDCWKPIVRDPSTQPSRGISLGDLAAHPHVDSIVWSHGGDLVVANIFGERFHRRPVDVDGSLAFHASPLYSF